MKTVLLFSISTAILSITQEIEKQYIYCYYVSSEKTLFISNMSEFKPKRGLDEKIWKLSLTGLNQQSFTKYLLAKRKTEVKGIYHEDVRVIISGDFKEITDSYQKLKDSFENKVSLEEDYEVLTSGDERILNVKIE